MAIMSTRSLLLLRIPLIGATGPTFDFGYLWVSVSAGRCGRNDVIS